MKQADLLTAKEAAAYLRVTVRTLRNWHNEGIGPKRTPVGKNGVRYRRTDLEAYATTEKQK